MATKAKKTDDMEDIFLDEISKNKNKDDERDRQRAIQQHTKLEKSLEGCEHCIDSKNMLKHLIVTCGTKVYIALPARRSLVKGHCLITTLQHSTCVTALDEDVWEEILVRYYALSYFYNCKTDRRHQYPFKSAICLYLFNYQYF